MCAFLMTIAVAAKYPWGILRQLIPQGIVIPEAVVLLSDSRFSRKIPTGYDAQSDSGTKIFQLGNDVACVYAGVCTLGEKCVEELRFRLSRQRNPNSATSRRIAQETLNRVYRHEIAVMRLNPNESPLYILLGACNQKGKAELYRFNYNENFKPVWINGYDVIGWPKTATRFIELFSGEIQRKVDNELTTRNKYPQIPWEQWFPIPIRDGEVALIMIAILNSIVEDGSDDTIGGHIQSVMVTMQGVSYQSASSSKNPVNPHPEWAKVTADYVNLETITGITGTIGVYHSSI